MRHVPAAIIALVLAAAGWSADAPSPFVDRPSESYSGYTTADGKPAVLKWGSAPFTDFGSRAVTLDQTGVRPLRQIPAPGVHPRILFTPDDLPDVRRRIRETRCGQEAWKNLLCWTEMMKGRYDDQADYAKPDRWNGGFGGLHGRVPLFRLNVPREQGHAYNRHPGAAAIYAGLAAGSAKDFPTYYWNVFALEALRCLIEDDGAAARTLAAATVTAMKLDQAKRITERAGARKKSEAPPAQPVGGFQLAFTYDLIHQWLDPAQRQAIHDELAETTWSHDNYGTFNTAESSRSNWATFSYWLFEVLAIEDEPGFNELKVRGMYRGWRNLLTYGWFPSGATYEGEAKNQLGMDGIMLFAMRSQRYGFDNLCGHPYLQAYARRFLPHSSNAMLTGFHRYDLLGGSRAGKGSAAPMDALGLKFMFPGDRVIDWYFRQAMGEDYSGIPDRPDGYFNALLFYAIYAADFDPANTDPKALGLGDTFFCGERALMMTRSSWEPSAMQLNLHVRQANGGHPFADRNAIMVAGAGRIWSPNGYASFRTGENSVVGIDGQSQSENVPGRMVDFQDRPLASFAVGDARYAWDWTWHRLNRKGGGYYTTADLAAKAVAWPPGSEPELHTVNDFAFLKLPHAYLDRPMTEAGDWILPTGAISPFAREPRFPVVKAFRSAGLVRGPRPYALVVDDIRKDDAPHRYDWTLALEYDLQIAGIDHRADGICDILLTGGDPDQKEPRPKTPLPSARAAGAPIPAGQPMLLVRFLAGPAADTVPTIVEPPNEDNAAKYQAIRRLVVPVTTVEPGFKVVFIPHRQGEVLPTTTWNADRTEATVGDDRIRFAASASGKTDITITRSGSPVIAMDRALAPFRDAAAEQREADLRRFRQELAGFDTESIPGRMPLVWPATMPRVPGRVGQALSFTGAKDGVALPVDLRASANGFTLAWWFRVVGPVGGSLFASNGNRGLGVSFDQGKTLRIDALGQHRWSNTPMNYTGWHHLAMTGDGRRLVLMVDGQEVRAEAIAAPMQFAAETRIGTGFTGLIDDLRVYGRALAPEELGKLYRYQAFVAAAPR